MNSVDRIRADASAEPKAPISVESPNKPPKEIDGAIALDLFGKDHWSTFLYVETRVVDYSGKLDPAHMRKDGAAYPTKLKDNAIARNHNDYECVHDLEDAGLLVNNGTGLNPLLDLTTLGWKTAMLLRRWRAYGRGVALFDPRKALRGWDELVETERAAQIAAAVAASDEAVKGFTL